MASPSCCSDWVHRTSKKSYAQALKGSLPVPCSHPSTDNGAPTTPAPTPDMQYGAALAQMWKSGSEPRNAWRGEAESLPEPPEDVGADRAGKTDLDVVTLLRAPGKTSPARSSKPGEPGFPLRAPLQLQPDQAVPMPGVPASNAPPPQSWSASIADTVKSWFM